MTLSKLAEKIAFFLLRKQVIEQEQTEICAYGMEVLIASLINGVLVLAAAVLLRVFWQTVLLLVPFMLIRSSAGGYHAKTHTGCMAAVLIVYIAGVCAVKAIPAAALPSVTGAALLFSTAVLLSIGAVGHENRPVTDGELARFKKRARLLAVLLSTIGLAGFWLWPELFSFYTLGLFIAACSLLAAWINEKRKGVQIHGKH